MGRGAKLRKGGHDVWATHPNASYPLYYNGSAIRARNQRIVEAAKHAGYAASAGLLLSWGEARVIRSARDLNASAIGTSWCGLSRDGECRDAKASEWF